MGSGGDGSRCGSARLAALGVLWLLPGRVLRASSVSGGVARWEATRKACRELGFSEVECRLGGRTWSEALAEINGAPSWRMEVPLGNGDYVPLSRPVRAAAQPTVLAPLAELLHAGLGAEVEKQGALTGRARGASDQRGP